MGPKKKKQPKNAFYFFMCEWKEEKEDQGQRFPGGLKEVSEKCAEDWKYLPDNRLEHFKRLEKEAKNQDKTDLTNKFTSTGKSYKQLADEKREANLFQEKMFNEIRTIMEESKRNLHVLQSRCFYLIHANVYIYWGERNKWVPCEVAVSEFNLVDGLRRTHHVFPGVPTRDGKLPLGYKLESNQRREIHFVPDPEEFDRIENDYDKIYVDLLAFLQPNGGKDIPLLFTMEDDFNTNSNMTAVRDFLDNVAGDEEMNFRVYPLPLFFYHLRDTCAKVGGKDESFPSLGLALQQLERDYYNFHEELACDFHIDTEGYPNCSLSVVKRWVFLICEYCCQDLDLPLIPGLHCVKTAKINTLPSYKPNVSSNSVAAVHTVSSDHRSVIPRSTSSGSNHPTSPLETSAGAARPFVQQPTLAKVVQSASNHDITAGDAQPVDQCGSTAAPRISGSLSLGRTGWGRGIPNTALEKHEEPMDERRPGSSTQSAWQVVGRGTSTSTPSALTLVDHSKVPDPSKTKTYKTGQSPNVVSEIYSDDSPNETLRLPSSRGRGESLAFGLGQKDSPAPSFTLEDFPAVGAPRSSGAQPQRPIASAWGRGFSSGPKP